MSGYPKVFRTTYQSGDINLGVTYVSILEVVKMVLGQSIDPMLLLVVELGILALSSEVWSCILHLWLVLENVLYINILASVVWKACGLLDIDSEENFLS